LAFVGQVSGPGMRGEWFGGTNLPPVRHGLQHKDTGGMGGMGGMILGRTRARVYR
jgi:hypothetical protein